MGCASLFFVSHGGWRLEVAHAVSQSGRRFALAEEFVNLRAFQKSPIANCRRHEREIEFGEPSFYPLNWMMLKGVMMYVHRNT